MLNGRVYTDTVGKGSTMELFEALHSQRAIRYFKPDPVPDDLIQRVLEAAIRAPNGSNRQSWGFVVLKDQAVRQRVGELYQRAWDAGNLARLASDPDPSVARVFRSADHLARRIGEAPALILACIRRGRSPASLADGASIYPAVQNLMLAARGLGLGTVITTVFQAHQEEIKALLGIPENVETAALIPMGYPAPPARFGPTNRRPVHEVAYLDRWGTSFGASSAQ